MKSKYYNSEKYSVFRTVIWVFFLTLGLQTVLGFIAVAGIDSYGVDQGEIEQILTQPNSIAIIGIIAALFSIPLIKKASNASGKPFPYKFLAFQRIQKKTFVKVQLKCTITYSLSIHLH
jgi:hypothetical protein